MTSNLPSAGRSLSGDDVELRLRALDHSPSPIVIVDTSGLITFCNTAMEELTGWRLDDARGTVLLDYLHPDDHGWIAEAFLQIVDVGLAETEHRWASVRCRIVDRSGRTVPVEVTGAAITDRNGDQFVLYDVRPSFVQHNLARVLAGIADGSAAVPDLLGMVLRNIALPPLHLDAAVLSWNDGDHAVLASTSPVLSEVLEEADQPPPWAANSDVPIYEAVELLPERLRDRLTAERYRDLWHLAVESPMSGASFRIVACTPDRHTPAVGALDRLRSARQLISVVLLRSDTDALLKHAARHDQLTGLKNRAGFQHQFAADAPRDGDVIALFVDLDGFKEVNDQHGHAVGDDVLRTIARRLQDACRPDDIVARLGGDEFAVVLGSAGTDSEPQDDERGARMARRMLREIEVPVALGGGHDVVVSASIGVAQAPACTELESLVARADAAMYRAKRSNSTNIEFAPRA